MKSLRRMTLAALIVGAAVVPGSSLFAGTETDDKGFVTLKPGNEDWKDAPGYNGVQLMVVEGDPTKAGPYVIRVKFSPGTMSMPHQHPDDRLVTVIKGTWYTGTSETFEPASTKPLPTGSFMKHPAGAAHYDGAKDGEVIVQIMGVGPSGTVFFKPELGKTGRSLP
ncbi:MAG: cupin domain-containing protein [Burkholderiales bacterium]|nr:cupin domain-containing protein [Burkholderiales bacterium]